MSFIEDRVDFFIEEHKNIQKSIDKVGRENMDNALPQNAYFLSDGSVLCLPRNKGYSRYVYANDGFNFWTYDSGYMHANQGLFSPFLRASEGEEPKIAFFAGSRQGDKYSTLPLLSVPVMDSSHISNVVRYTVFDETATYYITETNDFTFAVCVFTNHDHDMHFTVIAKKRYPSARNISLAYYFNPTLKDLIYDDAEARWFKSSEYISPRDPRLSSTISNIEDKNLGKFLFSVNVDRSRELSVSNFAVLNSTLELDKAELNSIDTTTSRKNFVGAENNALYNAESLKNANFSEDINKTNFTDNAIAGQILQISTSGKSTIRLDLLLNYKTHSLSLDSYKDLFREENSSYFDEALFEKQSAKAEQRLDVKFSKNTDMQISGKVMSNFMSYLKHQIEFCSTLSGYAQLQENSLIGTRDIFQAIEAYLLFRPEVSREKIIEGIGFIDSNGRAPRQYSLPLTKISMPRMDLRPYIDQGIWIVNTIITYLKFTNDFTIIREMTGYYDVIDGPAKVVKRSDIKDTVFEHILRIMDYLISNIDEETKCLRTLFGDWVDALDGLGVSIFDNLDYGSGVSVMASLQFYKLLGDVLDLFDHVRFTDDETIKKYIRVRKGLEEGLFEHAVVKNADGDSRIVHGWGDRKSYYVGSFNDVDEKSRHSLLSNAYWVLSGMNKKDKSLNDTVISAMQELTSHYGLKTFEPGFESGTWGVGRIHKLTEGTAENGAVYVHGSCFGIEALFALGEAKIAWKELEKVLPLTHDNLSTSPFVMSNSYGYNPELNIDGESMLDWQTGSSNMVMKILTKYVFGLNFQYDGIKFQAANYCPYESWAYSNNYQQKRLTVKYENKGSKSRTYKFNGKVMEAKYDEELKTYTWFLSHKDIVGTINIDIEIID